MASLAEQLSWCMTTQDQLNSLDQDMRYVANQYIDLTDMLRKSGYISEFLPEIEKMCNEFTNEAMALSKYIEQSHWQYIEKQKNTVQSLM